MTATISEWLRRGATAVAAGRVAIGVVALAAPPLVARPWVGAAADSAEGRVLARALGGRDLALGIGALIALQPPAAGAGLATAGSADADADLADAELVIAGSDFAGPPAVWVGLAAVADAFDLLATAVAWRRLPASRWLVALSAGGAAAVGAAAARSMISVKVPDGS
ncbi:MAG TPA: hypothetical protein VGL63_16980 [Streptosporangiaceae bacterium]